VHIVLIDLLVAAYTQLAILHMLKSKPYVRSKLDFQLDNRHKLIWIQLSRCYLSVRYSFIPILSYVVAACTQVPGSIDVHTVNYLHVEKLETDTFLIRLCQLELHVAVVHHLEVLP
jgi:hypothetical protein